MAQTIKVAGYAGKDAVRHIIKSHNSMLVSMPQEIAMRAGLARGVDVTVDYDENDPTTIIVRTVNPVDRSAELATLLGADAARALAKEEKKTRAVEAATKKKEADKAKAEKATKKKEAAAREAAMSPDEKEMRRLALRSGKSIDAFPKGWKVGDALPEGINDNKPEPKAAKVAKVKKPTAKEAGEILEARKAKAAEMGIDADMIQPDWRPGDAVVLGGITKPE